MCLRVSAGGASDAMYHCTCPCPQQVQKSHLHLDDDCRSFNPLPPPFPHLISPLLSPLPSPLNSPLTSTLPFSRWTEVFLIQVGPSSSSSDDDSSSSSKPHDSSSSSSSSSSKHRGTCSSFNFLDDQPDITRVSDLVARATAHALLPHLEELDESGKAKVGLRVTLGTEMVQR